MIYHGFLTKKKYVMFDEFLWVSDGGNMSLRLKPDSVSLVVSMLSLPSSSDSPLSFPSSSDSPNTASITSSMAISSGSVVPGVEG